MAHARFRRSTISVALLILGPAGPLSAQGRATKAHGPEVAAVAPHDVSTRADYGEQRTARTEAQLREWLRVLATIDEQKRESSGVRWHNLKLDQGLLAWLAETPQANEYYDVRKHVIERITDDSLLARIVVTERPAGSLQLVAVQRLSDQQVLGRIARSDDRRAVREAAFARLVDPARIIEFLREHPDPGLWVPAAVARRLESGARILREEDIGEAGRVTAVALLGEDILRDFASPTAPYSRRLAAAWGTTDLAALEQMAMSPAFVWRLFVASATAGTAKPSREIPTHASVEYS
jgi:hypothetical protein